jgi:hypothetical protein
VAPDDRLGAKIIEVNKGPDLGFKDKRDAEVKLKVAHDIFNKIGVSELKQGEINGFVPVWANK